MYFSSAQMLENQSILSIVCMFVCTPLQLPLSLTGILLLIHCNCEKLSVVLNPTDLVTALGGKRVAD